MNRRRVAILIALAIFLSSPGLRAAQDEAPTPNEQAEEYAKEFKKNVKKLSEAELIEAIDKLAEYYKSDQIDDKNTRGDLLEALSKTAGVRDNVVVAHLMKKCGELDEQAVKIVLPVLKKELGQKVPDDTVYEAALEALGKLRVENKAVIKAITDLLNHKDAPVIARACRAIAGYAAAGGEVRKELFEEVLKASEGTYSSAMNADENYKRKWAVIGDDVMEALVKLSNVAIENPKLARDWFNENKKKSWDREEDK